MPEPGEHAIKCAEEVVAADWEVTVDWFRALRERVRLNPVHCGDCTREPQPCEACHLEDFDKQVATNAAIIQKWMDKREQEGWVSVKERLPEAPGVYEVCRNDMEDAYDLAEYDGPGDPGGWDSTFEPTHWHERRPLPAPPEEG